jgi:hypothetical protein
LSQTELKQPIMSAKLSVLAGAVGVLLSASPLLAADAQGEHFLKESIQGNLAEVRVGQLAQELAALSGGKFDRYFIDSMVKDHKEDIAKYEKEAHSGSAAAAAYAKEILPDLRKHLQIAERLQSQLKMASAPGATG